MAPLARCRAAALALTGLSLAGALMLGGCSMTPTASSDDAARVDELEQQVQELQQQLEQSEADSAQSQTQTQTQEQTQTDADDQAQQQGQQTGAPVADTSVTGNYPEIADFESRVAAVEQDFASVVAGSDMNANYQTYLGKKREAEILESEMDLYDDQQEYAAETGQIPYTDYVQIEAAIDMLDSRLERAEDALQYALGIWDD